jgi:ribosome-binding factor A
MPGRRVERLNEAFRREISEIVRLEAKDPRVGLATITGVRVAPDLSTARVFVSAGADGAASGETLEGLRNASPFIRGELGRRLHIRRVPELRFELDRTLEQAMRIESLLSEVRASEANGAAGGAGAGAAGDTAPEPTGDSRDDSPGDAPRDDDR